VALFVLAAGCKSDGDVVLDPGAIALVLAPAAATVTPPGATEATATVTRTGPFSGDVTLTVTGAPAGVTVTIGDPETVGKVTTAILGIEVTAAAVPGLYPLVVRAAGSGITEASRTFSLTIAAP
jgi:hypothetical protein